MYSKVDTKFWTDEKVLAMSADARYIMLYLLTTKHRNMIGLYILPLSYAQEDTALSDKRFRAAWREVIDSGMVLYDDNARVVCVRNFLRYNPIEGPKQVSGAIARLDDLPKTEAARAIVDTLRAQTDKPHLIPLAAHIEAVCLSLPHTVHNTLSDTLSDTPSDRVAEAESDTLPDTSKQITVNSKQITDNSNEDHESIGHPAEAKQKPRRSSDALTAAQSERFERFWTLYPRKVSKGAAAKAWKRINPDDALTDKIIDGVTDFVHFDPRAQGEDRFIPHPATWLNASEWTNEYPTRQPQPAPRPRGNTFDTLGVLSDLAKGGTLS